MDQQTTHELSALEYIIKQLAAVTPDSQRRIVRYLMELTVCGNRAIPRAADPPPRMHEGFPVNDHPGE